MRALLFLLGLGLPFQALGLEPYTAISIVHPASEAIIHNNDGTLEVALSVAPALQIEGKHRIRIHLDGIDLPETRLTTQFSLTNIERGTHTLQAAVVDQSGRALITSAPVTFHMWRASARFPSRQKPAP